MSFISETSRLRVRTTAQSMLALVLLTSASCSKSEVPATDSATALAPAPSDVPASAPSAALTTVRGAIAAISDTSLTVTTASGPQQIHIVAPLRVYDRGPSDLAHVTPNSFVGITSVTEQDGSQRATEIHIFPEELRGTGEGSRLMDETGGTKSTMTNGTVSAASPSRMTNGAVSSTGGGTSYTVQYQGGTQTIAIPANVTVTIIAPTQTKLAVGTNVTVLATTGAGGGMNTSSVMLAK